LSANFRRCGSVVVTGASRGLGLQMVDSLASGGFAPARIIATSRDPSRAQVTPHHTPEPQQLQALTASVYDQCVEQVGCLLGDAGLNCLINNAGVNVVADFQSVTAEQMMQNFHTNAVAPLMVTKAFLPLLKTAASINTPSDPRIMGIQRAAVINVTSLLGSVELNWGERANNFKWYPYRTSKAALNMVSRCMAVDLEPDGILCMAIHPGWVRTDMGGAQAPLSPEESISAVLSVIGGLTEKDHGSFLNFTGEQLPW
uniref:Si:dkey-12e7.4 n=1 Tax=Sphaeramia orbicularis TaxID=375764 RepID=A0A672ZXE9_9TELE